MTTPCPHCTVHIDIDPETHAALQGQAHLECPSCGGLVAVPPAPVKVSAAAAIHPAMPSRKPASPSTPASAHRGMNRNFLILGIAALLVLGGLGFYLASQKSGSSHVTNTNINGNIINNSYFQNLIATGVTTKADLEAIADIRPYGKNFIGVSQDSLTWEQARQLAERTGSQILPVAETNSTARTELLSWVEDTFDGQLLPSPWVSERGEATVLANSEAFPPGDKMRKGKAILYWQTDIRMDEAELKARKAYKNLGRLTLDEKIVFGAGTSTILLRDDLVFKEISPKLQILSENRAFPVYQSLWREENVFTIHPVTGEIPGTVDFSEITGKSSGNLIIRMRDDPRGDCRIEILKNNQSIEAIELNTDEWQTVSIPFDEDGILLRIHATGWLCEYAFITYEFSR